MSTATQERRKAPTWQGRSLLDGGGAAAGKAREALHRAVWKPALAAWCSPLHVEGSAAPEPALYVANHASHADTVAVRAALGAQARRRLAVAAADDYFFLTAARARSFTLAVGAFPFPRSGGIGLRRATSLLERGWSVLLYPQGTRNADSGYRPGALRLAAAGWPVVPVGISGTERILPKGARVPRRHAVAVVIAEPLEPAVITHGGMDLLVRTMDAVVGRAKHLVDAG